MGMAYFKPKLLLNNFKTENSSLYGLIPLLIFIIFFEIECFICYIYQFPTANIFPQIIPIPETQYAFYELFFAPFVNAGSFLLFYGVLNITVLKFKEISVVKTTIFFTFIWNTIALMAIPLDLLNVAFHGNLDFLGYIHPIALTIDLLYLIKYISKIAEISKKKALFLILPATIVFLTFRTIFLR